MRVGLIDVDGHRFPNLALMRISSYHKERGDEVEWWWSDLVHYDIVYKSKVFSDAYSKDAPDPMNADKVVKGGTGYAISLVDGREVYDKSKDPALPAEIEKCKPDYSIYPQYDFAISITSRGCPRGCPFCHVSSKEGKRSVRVASVSDFWWGGQERIEVLDPNILACKDRVELLKDYRDTRAMLNFNQGLDIRLIDDEVIGIINGMRLKGLHFAWDNPEQDLAPYFKRFAEGFRLKDPSKKVTYVLTNYNSTMEQNLYRIYTLWNLGFDPYVMIYDKPSAPIEIRRLQRWCNNKIIFKSCRFEDYDWTRH